MLALATILVAGKVTRLTAQTFDRMLKDVDFAMVLFTSPRCVPCKRLNQFLDGNSARYPAFSLDVEMYQSVAAAAGVGFVPMVGVYRRGRLLAWYLGQWAQTSLMEYCDSMTAWEIRELTTPFEVFEFRNLEPNNVLISRAVADRMPDRLLESLAQYFGGLVRFGIVNSTAAAALGINASVLRQADGKIVTLASLDRETVHAAIRSDVWRVETPEVLGMTLTGEGFLALVDTAEPAMVADVLRIFDRIRDQWSSPLSFQICDFVACERAVHELGVTPTAFWNGAVFAHVSGRSGRGPRFSVLPRVGVADDAVIEWAEHVSLGIEPQRSESEIPVLRANEFQAKVLDPTKDVVLLVADPGMPDYAKAASAFRALMRIMEPWPDLVFFEYNQLVEHVMGLQMPNSEFPQISVWPAREYAGGQAFVFRGDTVFALKTVPQLLAHQFTEQEMAVLQERMVAELGGH